VCEIVVIDKCASTKDDTSMLLAPTDEESTFFVWGKDSSPDIAAGWTTKSTTVAPRRTTVRAPTLHVSQVFIVDEDFEF
jgi:hypothetical protein